jgi:thiosulfate/3-mercaptopyruvate sulfurtransferase
MTSSPSDYTTLISAAQLQSLLASQAACMVFDCSCDLMQPATGPAQYQEAHIPGAVYAHLDNSLSAKGERAITRAASGGRHPLPARDVFAAWLGRVGFSNNMQAVVYDRQGANYCGRLWWMLKWLGHEKVAVLDGGWQAWQAAGGAAASGEALARGDAGASSTAADGQDAAAAACAFRIGESLVQLVNVDTVLRQLGQSGQQIVDARGAPRFRGEVEPIDPVAGHIPGALNRPFNLNLGADGHFKDAATLRAEFTALLGLRDPASVVHHCGSGLSAVPNILAMEIAGLGRTALFAGSWSEWCSDPGRPVAQG